MSGGAPDWRIVAIALLYSAGAHGIMTLNDFKSIEGDRKSAVRSLPVQLGPERAARLACITMAIAQVGVIILLLVWERVKDLLPSARDTYQDPNYLKNLETVGTEYAVFMKSHGEAAYEAFLKRIK